MEHKRNLREKSLKEMKELKRFQGLTFDTIAWIKLVEHRDTILELIGKIQELQNEINCMNDSRDFKDAESVRRGLSHVSSQPAFFTTFTRSWRNVKPFCGSAKPQRLAARYLGWYFGKLFCKSNGVFFSTLSARVQSLDFQCVRTYVTACNQ